MRPYPSTYVFSFARLNSQEQLVSTDTVTAAAAGEYCVYVCATAKPAASGVETKPIPRTTDGRNNVNAFRAMDGDGRQIEKASIGQGASSPTVSPALGQNGARLARELTRVDRRSFGPSHYDVSIPGLRRLQRWKRASVTSTE